jgi:hypothetical protein
MIGNYVPRRYLAGKAIPRTTELDHRSQKQVRRTHDANRSKERKMRKLIVVTMVFFIAGLPASFARGGMHGSGMHSPGMLGLMAPANPAVPPSLTPDPRLTGTAPVPPHHQPTSADVSSHPNDTLKLDPEDAAVDRAIGNICRGC